MSSFAEQKAFATVIPLCDLFAKEPTTENAKNLQENIERCSTAVVQFNLVYILVPIYIHLHNDKLNKDTKHHVVRLLRSILLKTRITKLTYFVKMYIGLLVQICDDNQQNMLIKFHEELKENTVECLGLLMKKCSTDVIESLYTRQHAAKLSQGIYTCLSIAKTEKSTSLRLSALKTLMSLSRVDDSADPNDPVLRAKIADIMMLFLPGIAHGLCQIAMDNELQNHKITVMAVRAYGRIIALVMADIVQEESITIDDLMKNENVSKSIDPLGTSFKLQGDVGIKKYIETTTLNQEWLDAASTKLNGLMRSLLKLARHPHVKVRNELIIAVRLILDKCPRNMMKNFMELIEILISLSEDEDKQVKESARTTLNEINERFTANYSMRPVVELLEENFYKLLTKLPRLIRRSDDVVQSTYLNQLAGYIRLLGKQRLPQVMASVSHLRRLLLALVYVSELDYSHVSVLEDRSVEARDVQDSMYSNLHSWKRFKFIVETETEDKLASVCKLLGKLGDLELLVDTVFDLISEMPRYRKELTLLLNWIYTVENKPNADLHRQIVEYYTRPDNWYLPLEVSEDVSLGDAQSNIVQCCISIEGLGNVAKILEEEYQMYLLKTLYLLIERAGSGNSLVNQAGTKVLEEIAKSQGYTNVADLLRDNVDYVSYHVTIKMRRVERNPGVLDVFSIVMRYSTMDVLPCLKPIVDDALAQLSVNRHDKNSQALLKVLYTFVVCMRKLTENTETRRKLEEPNDKEKKSRAEIVIQSVLEYCKAKRDSECIEEDIRITPDDIEAELNDGSADKFSVYETEEEKEIIDKTPPSHIKMTEDVMKCCLHFLPAKEVAKCLLAMQVLDEGLYILYGWSDEQLLPIVHKLWHPLVERFKDQNVLVINRAWQLLCTLSNVSKDFIRSRTLKQVLPAVSQFLTKSAKESYKKTAKDPYRFTQIYKLQRIILSESGKVARSLKLDERQLWQILDITEPYLSSFQHPTLQECCVQLFKEITLCNADIVWTKCLSIWHRYVETIQPKTELTLKNLTTLASDKSSDYRTNIENILTYIEQMDDDV